jgi:hypothetical protein
MDNTSGYEHALVGSNEFIEDGTLLYNIREYNDVHLVRSTSRYVTNE